MQLPTNEQSTLPSCWRWTWATNCFPAPSRLDSTSFRRMFEQKHCSANYSDFSSVLDVNVEAFLNNSMINNIKSKARRKGLFAGEFSCHEWFFFYHLSLHGNLAFEIHDGKDRLYIIGFKPYDTETSDIGNTMLGDENHSRGVEWWPHIYSELLFEFFANQIQSLSKFNFDCQYSYFNYRGRLNMKVSNDAVN